MSVHTLTKKLQTIEIELERYVTPNSKNGFFKKFVSWVIDKWESNNSYYFSSDIIDSGFDISIYPRKENLLLRNKVKSYAEFINSNTGNTIATYNSGTGITVETYSDLLSNYYYDSCVEEFYRLVCKYDIHIPNEFKDVDSISDLISEQSFDGDEYPELYSVCDSILCRFLSPCGYEIEQYLCESYLYDESFDKNNIFGLLTLLDFHIMNRDIELQ